MAAEKTSAFAKLDDITECCICLKTFSDPRMLPCIHTFCFQCLKDLTDGSGKKPGDALSCPVCRKELTIPSDGIECVTKNFFMTRMIEARNAFNYSKLAAHPCDICRENNDSTEAQIPEATVRCLTCRESLCNDCLKMHKMFKTMKGHEILNIGSDIQEEEEKIRSLQSLNCDTHRGKVLDYYCPECIKVVCVSCFVESHRTHDCKDVNTVEEEFRKAIKCNAHRISTLAKELVDRKEKSQSKDDFLKKMEEREEEILQRSEELKELIDEHTKSLLSSLDEIKKQHLKDMQTEEDELDIRFTVLQSFSRYCDELRSKGSAGDVCRNKDELLRRADELEEDHETYAMRPLVSFDVAFQATDLNSLLNTTNGNIIGIVNAEKTQQLENFVIAIGRTGISWNIHSYKFNLHGHSEPASKTEDLPPTLKTFPSAAVYDNTIFITGVGETMTEIWKYSFTSGWNQCGSLVQGREDHCSEFIDETLYICGGYFDETVLDSIEEYKGTTEESTVVGQLQFASKLAACLVYKNSIYVFGGLDEELKSLDCVQVFNPVERTCTLLTTPLPRPKAYMHAVLWETYAILVGFETCFIFDFDASTWQERQQLKADSNCFGLVLQTERVFLIDETELIDGSSDYEIIRYRHDNDDGIINDDKIINDDAEIISDDEIIRSRSDNGNGVKYIRASCIVNNEAGNWKSYGQLPESFTVIATAKLSSVG